jgi:type II secretory pathway component PulF
VRSTGGSSFSAASAAFFALKNYGKTPRGRYHIDSIKLRIPIVGELTLKMSIARFCRTFGTLINSGVPMMRSLEDRGRDARQRRAHRRHRLHAEQHQGR